MINIFKSKQSKKDQVNTETINKLEMQVSELCDVRRNNNKLTIENLELANVITDKDSDIQIMQSDYSLEIGNLMKDVYTNADKIRDDISSQSAYQQQTFASLEELKGKSDEVRQMVNKALLSRVQDEKLVGALGKGINTLNEEIIKLNNNLTKITKVVDDIHGFSEQTKMLGLNASIEAARAGENGRGFAVVASEIQKLSNQTKEASTEIQEFVNTLLSESDDVMVEVDKIYKTSNIIMKNNINSIENITVINAAIEDINVAIDESTKSAEHSSNTMQCINAEADSIADDIRVKPSMGVKYTGKGIRVIADGKLDGGGYTIKKGSNIVICEFRGSMVKSSTFKDKYIDLLKDIKIEDTELILDARDLGIFIGAMKSRLGPMYKQYAQFKKVYVITGDNHSMKMQLTNVFIQNKIEKKFEFIKSYIEQDDPELNKKK